MLSIVDHQPERTIRWEGNNIKREVGVCKNDVSLKIALFSSSEVVVLEIWKQDDSEIYSSRHCKNPRIQKHKNLHGLSFDMEDGQSSIRTDNPFCMTFIHLTNMVLDKYLEECTKG